MNCSKKGDVKSRELLLISLFCMSKRKMFKNLQRGIQDDRETDKRSMGSMKCYSINSIKIL